MVALNMLSNYGQCGNPEKQPGTSSAAPETFRDHRMLTEGFGARLQNDTFGRTSYLCTPVPISCSILRVALCESEGSFP